MRVNDGSKMILSYRIWFMMRHLELLASTCEEIVISDVSHARLLRRGKTGETTCFSPDLTRSSKVRGQGPWSAVFQVFTLQSQSAQIMKQFCSIQFMSMISSISKL